jgi:hypothetical protein
MAQGPTLIQSNEITYIDNGQSPMICQTVKMQNFNPRLFDILHSANLFTISK